MSHRPVAPMAYLDHCALRKFSEDAQLGPRLTSALHARNGSLAISWLNFGEYATVTDPTQRRAAEQFLDGMLPAISCIDVGPAVMDRVGHGQPFPHAEPQQGQRRARLLPRGGPWRHGFCAKR